MPFFVDRGSLSNARRTAVGGMLVDARLARTGVLVYDDGQGGTVRRYNPPTVLEAALLGLETAPVTHKHPGVMVTTHNYSKVARGHVVGVPSFDGKYIKATLALNDLDLISDVENGTCCEVSMGYFAEHDGKPGVDGEETYDEARTKIRWNHVALVPSGRAGRDVRLTMDSADQVLEEVQPPKPKPEFPPPQQPGDPIPSPEPQPQPQPEPQPPLPQFADVSVIIAERDAARADLELVRAELAKATSKEALDAAVTVELEKRAKLAQAQKRRAAVAARYPKLSLDGRTQEAIDALYDALESEPTGAQQLCPAGTVDAKPSAPAQEPRKSPRERMLEELRSQFKH